MGLRVVSRTDHDEVGEVRRAAVDPTLLPVVRVGPGRGPVTVLDPAQSLLLDQLREPLTGAGEPAAPAEVQHSALPVEHRRDHAGRARQPARGRPRGADLGAGHGGAGHSGRRYLSSADADDAAEFTASTLRVRLAACTPMPWR
jgi:hypothetical protein